MGSRPDYSEAVAADIDGEVRVLIEAAHDEAWEILVEYRAVLDQLVLELMEKETLTKEDMARICAPVTKRPSLAPYNGFGKRTPSDQPPVLTPTEAAAGRSANGHGATAVGANGSAGQNGVGLVKGGNNPVGDVGAPVQR
jgi:cell division protease FtsH